MTDSRITNINLTLPMLLESRINISGKVTQVFDIIRNKWVVLTPEEFVRQRFVDWLINVKGYSQYRIANEIGLIINKRSQRCDTVVFTHDNNPFVIVEYKAPQITITQKVFDQIVRYNSALRAKYLVVTNGISMFCCEIDYTGNSYRYINDLPAYKQD